LRIVWLMLSKLQAGGVFLVVVSLPTSVDWKSSAVSFFAPTVELSEADRDHVRNGRVLVRTVESSGHDLAVFAAGSLDITPELFVSRVQDIVTLRRSRFVPLIGRFSNPPILDDLAALSLTSRISAI
jgi:hypothetical protein